MQKLTKFPYTKMYDDCSNIDNFITFNKIYYLIYLHKWILFKSDYTLSTIEIQ